MVWEVFVAHLRYGEVLPDGDELLVDVTQSGFAPSLQVGRETTPSFPLQLCNVRQIDSAISQFQKGRRGRLLQGNPILPEYASG